MNELVFESASRQLELLRLREVSISELAEAHIAQIERLNPGIHAFADFDSDRVRSEAQRLQQQDTPRGPLHGLPITIKSSIATAGYRCEIGSLLHQGDIPREDATVVTKLRTAGALILGTTNCPEFLMAYETVNLLHGRTSNPWNLDCTPGGSSGGEAAAIASGMSAAGVGSDSGGSVRVPAHFTGICALKPTPGRISSIGHLPPCVGPFSTLGAIGPMARTMEDIGLLFHTLSGYHPIDPISTPVEYCEPSFNALRTNVIGYFEDDGLVPVTTETRSVLHLAVAALRDAGFRVEPFRPRTLELLRQLWWKFFVQCGAMFYSSTIRGREHQLSPLFQEFLGFSDALPALGARQLLEAWAELDWMRAKTLEELRDHPVLLCPVASIPAFLHDEREWVIDGRVVEYLDAMRYSQWFNVLASPAAVVPVGRSGGGLPIGVQIVARPFQDEVALGIAGILDAAFGYKPPL